MIIYHRRPATAVDRPQSAGALDPDYRRMHPLYALLLRVWGPADSWDNPLVGTRYDSRVAAQRQHACAERHQLKADAWWERWDHRLHGHNPVPHTPRYQKPDGGFSGW